MIAIINYGSGNIQAIANIFARAGVAHEVAETPAQLDAADRFLLPGVGAFDECMRELNVSGMRDALDTIVARGDRPILGICVGMQLLAASSEEGTASGLGWVDGTVKRFRPSADGAALQLPHMGWNTVEPTQPHPLFDEVDLTTGYYFLHSYFFECARADDTLATTEYGGRFASAVHRGNVFGVQFHPEKSHQAGIRLLQNFAQLPV